MSSPFVVLKKLTQAQNAQESSRRNELYQIEKNHAQLITRSEALVRKGKPEKNLPVTLIPKKVIANKLADSESKSSKEVTEAKPSRNHFLQKNHGSSFPHEKTISYQQRRPMGRR